MKTPCANCPFRSNVPFFLRKERAQRIANDVINGDTWFACHKTVNYDANDEGDDLANASICIGSILSIAKQHGNAMANLGVRLKVLCGEVDLSKIDDSVPVWNADEFVENVGIL